MPAQTSFPHGTPSWVDLPSTDVEAASSFYSALFGWDVAPAEQQDAGDYRMARLNGAYVAGIAQQQPEAAASGAPPMWNTYVTVDDVDAAAEQIEKAGGTVLMKPTDIVDAGRMAFAMDPGGAAFAVWEARNHKGAGIVNEPGTQCWNELNTRDTDGATRFYGTIFGWEARASASDAMPYTEFHLGERPIGGMIRMTEEWGDAPPHWMVYFAVEDCDATVAKCAALGGKECVPATDIPVGRFAVLEDPQGATFSVIRLNEAS
ncbi:MAG: VOC family protein [Acidimicrobiia bacterium]|nr:VOC family protein [Acidimicrobiia bacterium]